MLMIAQRPSSQTLWKRGGAAADLRDLLLDARAGLDRNADMLLGKRVREAGLGRLRGGRIGGRRSGGRGRVRRIEALPLRALGRSGRRGGARNLVGLRSLRLRGLRSLSRCRCQAGGSQGNRPCNQFHLHPGDLGWGLEHRDGAPLNWAAYRRRFSLSQAPVPQELKGRIAAPIAAAMTEEEVLKEFRDADALLEGHFILSSGLRSPRYLQCARLLMDPARAERIARALAGRIPEETRSAIDIVVSPAMGGVIIGHEMGRALGRPAVFVERPEGRFELRRGFRLDPGAKVLMVEDVVTTGLSSREAIKAIGEAGGEVIAAASIVDRSGGSVDLGVPYTSLIRIDVPTYEADSLPPELEAIPAIKPGSRAAA